MRFDESRRWFNSDIILSVGFSTQDETTDVVGKVPGTSQPCAQYQLAPSTGIQTVTLVGYDTTGTAYNNQLPNQRYISRCG